MRAAEGAWVGWAGRRRRRARAVRAGRHVLRAGAAVRRTRSSRYYEGFSNDTLWPIYHDVIVPATFHRAWWNDLPRRQPPVRRGASPRSRARAAPSGCTTTSCSWCRPWCASCARTCGSAGSTTSRSRRSSCSPSCPWRRAVRRGAAGRRLPRLPAHRRRRELPARLPPAARHDHQGRHRRSPPHGSAPERTVRASAIPISVDFRAWRQLAQRPRGHRALQGDPRVLGNPRVLMLGSTGSTTPRASGTGSRPTRSCCTTGRSRRRTPCWCRWRRRAASAWRPTASCARRSRRRSGG